MGFSGKATFGAGVELPELAEDVTDIVSVVSPFETPFLDHIGDSARSAQSTVHEWLEDTLLINFDSINQSTFTPNPTDATSITVFNGTRFQPGDLVKPGNTQEVMLVVAVAGNVITVTRRYGSTPGSALANLMKLNILGNAAFEGADASNARFTSRMRRQNYTQIFSATCEVTDTMKAVRTHGVEDELDYQKQERLRELLRDLENCVINGAAPTANPQGSPTTRRSMNGILKLLSTNQFVPGASGFPPGGGAGTDLNEPVLNAALRAIWEQSSGRVDTILVNGAQKRRINQFISTAQRNFAPDDKRISEIVSVYESDFGVCRVLLSRWVPADTLLLLDSSRVGVMPLAGREFQFRSLAKTGDATAGQLVGEYTLELRNENAHGVVRGLSTT
ncbi:MAG: SU10 major capsid protein [Phycisphaerales bacterium]